MKTLGTPSARILVVDDHPNTATTLARAILQLGSQVDVIIATSGREALEKVADGAVDILFTDMIMPEMTGLELIEKLKNHPGGRPSFTYLITAYDVPGLKETARRLKVNEVIVKPVRPERICQITLQAIEQLGQGHSTKNVTAATRKFKVLVADDRPDNVTLLMRYLEYEGYEQIAAFDGQEALDKTRDELPDLILLDVDMPKKDGFTVLGEIRADVAIAHIPVIILTAARLQPSDMQSGLNLGADDYVTKPFERHELMARIRTKLRVKEAQDVIRRRNRELSLLPEIGKELSARLDIEELANVLLRRTVETLGAFQGDIILLDVAGIFQKMYHFSDSTFTTISMGVENPITDHLLKHICETRQGLIIENTQRDPNWLVKHDDLAHSAIAVPLFGRHELLGLLVLTHEQEKYFSLDHLLLLQAIASQAAIAIENAYLYTDVAQQQKRLSAVLQSAAEAILMFDAEGRLNLLNPAGEKLFTDFNVSLNHPLEAGHGYDALIQMLEDARISGFIKSGEIVWPDTRTFMVLITPIESGGLVAILHDVTHFKKLEQVKNEFIATASHDLKNPITSIAGYSELLLQAGPLNDLQSDFAHRIQTAANTMNELVQNMMQLAQTDLNATQHHASVEMGTLLAELADEYTPQANAKEQTLHFNQLTVPVYVNGNLLQLKQLFRNLIGNAIKYTPQGGVVTLSSIQVDTKNIEIKVQDTGFGIPTADLPFIFDRFYRVHDGKANTMEGNGLGLAIVKSIVAQHNGQVTVESEFETGSCFTICLPILPVEISTEVAIESNSISTLTTEVINND